MNVELKPELARYIEKQVKSGRYDTPDDAVNAAVAKLQLEEELLSQDLDDEDVAAIEEGLAQLNRGEGRPWEQVRAEIQARLLSKQAACPSSTASSSLPDLR